jgi:ornithine cyclodeaminase
MQIRILSASDVQAAIDMPAAIDAMRSGFSALARGEAVVPVRLPLETRHGVTLFMPAHLSESGRTGAKGLAADLLAAPDASVVALYGAGVQARTQLEAVRCVRDIREVRIVSGPDGTGERLAAELSGLEARAVSDPEEALAGAHIVVAATTSRTPVFDGSRVEPGTHVTGVGSFTPEMREVDTALIRRARVIVDQREAVLEEAGDIIGPIRDGDVDESVIAGEIGEILIDAIPGRTSADQITFFKSVGNAIQDVEVADRVLEVAERDGLGVIVDL